MDALVPITVKRRFMIKMQSWRELQWDLQQAFWPVIKDQEQVSVSCTEKIKSICRKSQEYLMSWRFASEGCMNLSLGDVLYVYFRFSAIRGITASSCYSISLWLNKTTLMHLMWKCLQNESTFIQTGAGNKQMIIFWEHYKETAYSKSNLTLFSYFCFFYCNELGSWKGSRKHLLKKHTKGLQKQWKTHSFLFYWWMVNAKCFCLYNSIYLFSLILDLSLLTSPKESCYLDCHLSSVVTQECLWKSVKGLHSWETALCKCYTLAGGTMRLNIIRLNYNSWSICAIRCGMFIASKMSFCMKWVKLE